jgi:hypothetical protein
MAGRPLFSSRWADVFSALNGIQSVLGSPGEEVRHRWLGLAEKTWIPPPGENRPNILDETMDGCFPPGAGNLKLLIKQMLNYDIGQRLKLKQCIKSSVFKDVNRPIAIAEWPSMQCFRLWSQQTGTEQTRMQASVDRIVPPCLFVPIANIANC